MVPFRRALPSIVHPLRGAGDRVPYVITTAAKNTPAYARTSPCSQLLWPSCHSLRVRFFQSGSATRNNCVRRSWLNPEVVILCVALWKHELVCISPPF